MSPEIIKVNNKDAIAKAVAWLQKGELIAFPTDTVYGIAAHGFMSAAVEKLYKAKRRPRSLAIPLLLADAADTKTVATAVPPAARRLIARFWPGALTLVLPRRDVVPDIVCANGATVAVRVPAHNLTREIIAALGAPLAATSANFSGEPIAKTANEVREILGEDVGLIIDGKVGAANVASTVLDVTSTTPKILRAGVIPEELIREALV